MEKRITRHDWKTATRALYDYDNQAWTAIVDHVRRYVPCAHPANMDCKCYGRAHAGEVVAGLNVRRILVQNGVISA